MKNNTCIFYPMMMILLFIFIPILTNGQENTTTTAEPPELRIAIPVREFEDWVRVEHDPITGEQQISGFAIQVFKAVVNKGLSSPISYKLVPFVKSDGVTMNGTFDDMLQAVFNQEYDGAVGEISILYPRTEWVDFTLPYMDTQISMLIRQNHQRPFDKGGGISLASATKYFVAATLGFSFVVALVFWILEYSADKHSSLSKNTNVDDDNWQRNMLGSITHTRLVIIMFFMVLLILIACYSAIQTSSLSSQNQNGGFKNLNQLIRKGSNVGYRTGSFLYNRLIEIGFSESKLISLDSEKQMADMLAKGTENGGVDAIVADIPNLKLLLDKNCNTFTMVPSVNLPAIGFGFAFRKDHSTLTNEFSKGILRVIESGDMERIQERTIGNFDTCGTDSYNSGSNPRLDNNSLWILTAGGVGVFIIMVIIILLYCGFRCNGARKKRVVAYPCYLLPCC